MIAVFAYAFPHRKTQDFLFEIAMATNEPVCVLAAPHEQLKHYPAPSGLTKTLRQPPAFDTQAICKRLGFSYYEVRHKDVEAVLDILTDVGATVGIVSGARILKREVIEALG